MAAVLDRFIRRKSAINLTPRALEALRDLKSPPMPVYGSTIHESIMAGYGALYRSQPAVRICVEFLARNIAQLNIKTYRRAATDDRRELPDHPAAVRLQHPNDYTTRYRMMFGTIADLGIYENAFWLKMRQGGALALVRIPPEIVSISGSPWVKATEYVIAPSRMFGNENEIHVLPSDIIHFRGYDPLDQRMGVSPLLALRSILMEDAESRAWRRGFWRKAARMEGVIERPIDAPDWDDDARRRFREDWQNATAGIANSGKTAVLEEGMRFNSFSFSPKETEWISGRKLALEEAARAYHIPPSMLGLSAGGAAPGSVVEERKMLYGDTLAPILEMIEEELQLSLLPEFDDIDNVYFEFNLLDKLKSSFEEQATILTTAVGGPWLTTNEARSRQNLPKKDDGDELIVPMNVTKGGQPAPTVPTQDPSSPIPAEDQANPPKAIEARRHASFLKTSRDQMIDEAEAIVRRAFERQRNTVAGGKGFARERWDRELTADLWQTAVKTAAFFGSDAAERIGGEYDEPRTHAYLLKNAEFAARGINDTTQAALADAEPSAVFDVAVSTRAPQIAMERTTFAMNFGVQEAAHQNGE